MLEIASLRTKLAEAMKFPDVASTIHDEVTVKLAQQEQKNKELHAELQALKSSHRAMGEQTASL